MRAVCATRSPPSGLALHCSSRLQLLIPLFSPHSTASSAHQPRPLQESVSESKASTPCQHPDTGQLLPVKPSQTPSPVLHQQRPPSRQHTVHPNRVTGIAINNSAPSLTRGADGSPANMSARAPLEIAQEQPAGVTLTGDTQGAAQAGMQPRKQEWRFHSQQQGVQQTNTVQYRVRRRHGLHVWCKQGPGKSSIAGMQQLGKNRGVSGSKTTATTQQTTSATQQPGKGPLQGAYAPPGAAVQIIQKFLCDSMPPLLLPPGVCACCQAAESACVSLTSSGAEFARASGG